METTNNDNKRKRLFDLIEHPEKYSDNEINELLSDEEVRSDYETLAAIKHAIVKEHPDSGEGDIDVDEEWKHFSNRHNEHHWLKIAASIIGIIMVSSVAFAIMSRFVSSPINHDSNNSERTIVTTAKDSIKDKETESTNEENSTTTLRSDSVSTTSVTFENFELKDILRQMAEYYNANVEVDDEGMLSTRLYFVWDKSKSLEENIQLLNGFNRISLTLDGNIIKAEE